MKKTNKSPTPVTDSKNNKSDAPMNCVYASPEIYKERNTLSDKATYPYNHAVSLVDTTEIPSFCHVCGIVMASGTQFCPNCGTPQENKTTQNDDSSMGCVYAAPGRYSAPNKSGFLSKLFGRKK